MWSFLTQNGKNEKLGDMANLIPYLVPTRFQESIFPPITRPNMPAAQVLALAPVGERKFDT